MSYKKQVVSYLLGVIGSIQYDPDIKEERYTKMLNVSAEIIIWLDMHDMRLDSQGNKIYICNEVEYANLGPAPVDISVLSTIIGEA